LFGNAAFLSAEEDTYGVLVSLAGYKRIKYLFETELQYHVAWRVALQLAFKYTVRIAHIW
jgi:hypothetical protein